MRSALLAGFIALPALAAVPAWGQARTNQQDNTFVREAAISGQQEVAAGELAGTRSNNPAVQEFGRWMGTDHTMMNHMLDRRAKQAGIQLPSASSAQSKMDKLQNSSHFDGAYLGAQVVDHEKAVALFEAEERNGQNPGLKSLAREALPVLKAHLAEARALQSQTLANAPAGARVSVPSGGPTASVGQSTAATNQSPTVKQMNAEGAQKIEKEGK